MVRVDSYERGANTTCTRTILIPGLIHFIIMQIVLLGVQHVEIRPGQMDRKGSPGRILVSAAKYLRLLPQSIHTFFIAALSKMPAADALPDALPALVLQLLTPVTTGLLSTLLTYGEWHGAREHTLSDGVISSR
jgi:hypothetical protein